MLAVMQARVVQAPEFRTLRFRIPLAEFVAERKNAFLGAGLFFVAARAADQPPYNRIARWFRAASPPAPHCANRFRDADAPCRAGSNPRRGRPPVPRPVPSRDGRGSRLLRHSCDRYRYCTSGNGSEVLRFAPRPNAFSARCSTTTEILAARKQQRGPAALGDEFAQDMNRLGFEPVEVVHPGRRAGERSVQCGIERAAHVHVLRWFVPAGGCLRHGVFVQVDSSGRAGHDRDRRNVQPHSFVSPRLPPPAAGPAVPRRDGLPARTRLAADARVAAGVQRIDPARRTHSGKAHTSAFGPVRERIELGDVAHGGVVLFLVQFRARHRLLATLPRHPTR